MMTRDEFVSEAGRRRLAGLLLTGDTVAIKDRIKELGGIAEKTKETGKFAGWLMPDQESFDEAKALLESLPKPDPRWLITGNTYAIRDRIKELGGKPSYAGKKFTGWLMPNKDAFDEAKALVDAQPKARNFDVKRLSDDELARRGLMRVNGPRGPYVRRMSREDAFDEFDC